MTRGGRRFRWKSPAAYVAGTLLMCLAGIALVDQWEVMPRGALAGGTLAAWALQAAAVREVVRALDAGRSVLRPWVAGIGARFGGLAAAFVASFVSERVGESLALAYGGALVALLLLEAVWLAVRGQVNSAA